ncbi:hypothetical protein [Candidatus Liberibacter americanus]|uniref:Uncharacterized protein n=1 Tax=Candidatus Liberibacter americanus str. Sao Paulo TaxID=1261131 RepID=U6B8F6_9HYPH|nr:hypothetical protein [Candidatus Liberibacter americanus]AHA28017.1 hypothetical protein lam_671 [Candidatus Liberibacter americanus str. Sao Paulo]EMS35829.1 hypothetical protein G653_04681 [Candidatus Liberibacter americanus PW_SP]
MADKDKSKSIWDIAGSAASKAYTGASIGGRFGLYGSIAGGLVGGAYGVYENWDSIKNIFSFKSSEQEEKKASITDDSLTDDEMARLHEKEAMDFWKSNNVTNPYRRVTLSSLLSSNNGSRGFA